MGNAESHEEGSDYEDDDPHAGSGTAPPDEQQEATIQDDPFDGSDTLGYRVLGVQPNSPAAAAGLVSFLDFLVGCNGQMLLGSGENLEPGEEYDDVDLPAVLEAHKGKELEFLVWNIKSQSARLVPLTPSDTWGGAGLLGVTIRLDDYAGAEDRLVRVLTVEPNSPAEIAGLLPETDFLLGTTHQTLDSVDRLAVAVLQPNIDRVVELYVYNTETDLVRVVALMPTYKWGGGGGRRGLLGAEVGVGYLHRLPFKTRDTSGSSVERKVRYVNVENSTENRDNENNNSHKIQTPSSSTSSRRQLQPQLELEPQLEMEPGSDDDDDDEVESVALTPASTPVKPTHEQKAPSVVEDRKMAAAAAEPTYEQSQQQQQRKAPPAAAAAAPENTQTPTPNDYQRPQPAPNSAEALFKQPHRTYSSGSPQNNINQYQQQPPQPPQRTFSNTSSPNYYQQQQQQQQQQQAYEHLPPQPQHQQNPYSAAAAAPPPQRQSSYSAPPPATLSNGSSRSYTSPQPQPYGQVAAAVPTYQQKSSPQYPMQQQQQATRQRNPYSVAATAPGVGPQQTNSGYNLAPPPQMSYYGGGAAPSYAAGAGSASYGGGSSSAALPPPPMRNQQQQQQLHPYGGAAPYSASSSS